MAATNALSGPAPGLGPPPPPEMTASQGSPNANPLAGSGQGPGAPPGGQGQPPNLPPQVPAPTHQQTVAALRHFSAIEKELTSILKDPDLGKADLKSKVQDGTVKLVAAGILTPAQGVSQLLTFPSRPYDQKTWLENHFQQATQAATTVLSHHQAAFAGQAVDTTPPDPDNHQDDMAALAGIYGNGGNSK